MRNIIINIAINALAVAVTAWIVPGITFANDSFGALLVVALVIGMVNAVVRPILTILSLPFIIVTLGLFLFVINALMLLLVGRITPLDVAGFWSAGFGAIIISIVTGFLGNALQPKANES